MRSRHLLLVAVLLLCVSYSSAQTQVEVFNVQVYEGIYPDLLNAYGVNTAGATNHWLTQGLPVEGKRASFVFDPAYYLAHNADVATAYGATNYSGALQHFMQYGLSEGRRASLEFDVKWYLAHYPDLAARFGTNYQMATDDFINTGLPSLGRQGSADFSVQNYIAMYPDVSFGYGYRSTLYSDAIMHWLRRGKTLGRHGFGFFPTNPECGTGSTTEFGTVPATGPLSITVSRAGSFTSDGGVVYMNPPAGSAAPLVLVGANPAKGQYSVAAGVYSFNSADKEQPLQITYNLAPISSDYQRIFFADPAQYTGTFGDGSSPTSPLPPGSFSIGSHTITMNMDYQLRCRVEGGADCDLDKILRRSTTLVVCLAPGTYLTNGEYDLIFNGSRAAGTNLGFTLGAGWRFHGAGMSQTTVKLNSFLPIPMGTTTNLPPGSGYNAAFGTHDDSADNVEVSDLTVDLNYPVLKGQSPSTPLQLLGVQLRSNKGGHNIHNINVSNYASENGLEAFPIWIVSVAKVGSALSKNNQIKYTILGNSSPPPGLCTGITIANVQGEVAYNVANGWSSYGNTFGGCQGFGGWSLDNAWFHDNFALNNSASFLTDSLTNRTVTIEYNQFLNPSGWGMVIGGTGRYDYYTIQYNEIDLSNFGSTGILFQGDVTGANVTRNNITVQGTAGQNHGISFRANANRSLNIGNALQFNQISSRASNDAVPAHNCVFNNTNEQGTPGVIPNTQSAACAAPPAAYATLQTDGNFVVYGAAAAALWATNTYGTNATNIVMQNDSNLVVYQAIWQAGTYAPPLAGQYPPQGCSIGSNTLFVGQSLNGGQCIVSNSGQYLLYMSTDGNFYIYDNAHNIGTWGPGTQGHPGAFALMQADGNFVVYATNGAALWNSATYGSGANSVRIEDDGRIIIYKPAWTTGFASQSPAAMPHPPSTECADVGSGTGWTGVLSPGQCFVSPNGVYELFMQADGELILYDRSANPRNPIWINELQP